MSLPSLTESLKINANKLDLIRAITPTSLSKRKWPKQRNTIDETEHAGALYHRLLTLDYNFKVPGIPEGLENFEQFYQKLYRKSCYSSRNVTPSVSTLPDTFFSRSRVHSGYHSKKQSHHRIRRSHSHGRKIGSQRSIRIGKSFDTEFKDPYEDDGQPEEQPNNESADAHRNLPEGDSGDQLVFQLENEQDDICEQPQECKQESPLDVQSRNQEKISENQPDKQESPAEIHFGNQGDNAPGNVQEGKYRNQAEDNLANEVENAEDRPNSQSDAQPGKKQTNNQSEDQTFSHHSLRKFKQKHSASPTSSRSRASVKSSQSLRSKSRLSSLPISEEQFGGSPSPLGHSAASSPVSWHPSVQPSNPNSKPRKSSMKSLKNKDKAGGHSRRVSLLLDNSSATINHHTAVSLQELPSKHASLATVKESSVSDHKPKIRKLSRAKTFPPPQEKKHSCVPKVCASSTRSKSASAFPLVTPRDSQSHRDPPPEIYTKGILEHVSPKVQTRAHSVMSRHSRTQSVMSHHSKSSSSISGRTTSVASNFNIIDPISLIELHHKKYSRRGLATAVRLQRTHFEKEVEHLKNFNKHQYPYPAVRVKWREKYGNVKPITASMIRKALSKFGPVWTVSIESPFTATVVFTKFLDSCKSVAEKKIETDMIIITIYWYHRGLAERPFSLKDMDTLWEEITGAHQIYPRKSSIMRQIEVKTEVSEKFQNLTPKQSVSKARGNPEKLFLDGKKFSRTHSLYFAPSRIRKSVPSHIISPRRMRNTIHVIMPEDGDTDSKSSPRTDTSANDGRKQEHPQNSKEDTIESRKNVSRTKSLNIDLSHVHKKVPSHIVSPRRMRHTIHVHVNRHAQKHATDSTIIEQFAKANELSSKEGKGSDISSEDNLALRDHVKQFVDNVIKSAAEIYAAERIVQSCLAAIKLPGS